MPEIPEAVLDEIKRQVDLRTLVSEHVALKPSGRGFLGLCPFHEEKTPSFHVDSDRGFFHCFGCNAGGNAFTFLMKITGATFPEVVRQLAERTGVPLPDTRRERGLDRLAEVNALAAELFRLILHESRKGEPGRAYLASRGIDLDTARRFDLGFAPAEGWTHKLHGRAVTAAELERLGLARPSRHRPGEAFPLFRDRLIFPIRDLSGRVIAFGGRAVGEGTGPKYLNSPETPLYRKGHHLYGLREAREAIREHGQVILVEGYLDAIAFSQAGIRNVAAILGTALTVEQLRLARRFAEEIVICFDGDAAGRRAALRAFPLCVDEVDLWPRAVFLPPGEDPDSLVRGAGVEAVQTLIASGPSLIDFFLDDLVGADAGVGESARAAHKMAELLAGVKDPIVRDKLVRGAAGRVGVSPEALLSAARRAHAAARPAAVAARPSPAAARPGRFSSDAELVELIICDASVAERVRREGGIALISDPVLRAIGERVLDRRATDAYFEPLELLRELPVEMAERVRRRMDDAQGTTDEARLVADEWFARHAERDARGGRRALIARLRAAEHRGDHAEVDATLEALRRFAGPLERDEPR